MSSVTAIKREPRTLALFWLALLIWLAPMVRVDLPLPVGPPALPAAPPANAMAVGEDGALFSPGEPTPRPTVSAAQALVSFQPIPINRASMEALIALDAIGPVLAGRIIEQRKNHGPFHTDADLLAVHGIGPKKLAKILPQITFE